MATKKTLANRRRRKRKRKEQQGEEEHQSIADIAIEAQLDRAMGNPNIDNDLGWLE